MPGRRADGAADQGETAEIPPRIETTRRSMTREHRGRVDVTHPEPGPPKAPPGPPPSNPMRELLNRATGVHLQPDDVLLVGNVGIISRQAAAEIQHHIKAALPDTKVLIFEANIDLELLRDLEGK